MAQTTGIIRGRLVKVNINSVALDDQMDSEITITSEMNDTTTKQSTAQWREFLPSYKSATGSCSGYISFDATEGISQAFADIVAGTALTVLFTTGTTSDTTYSASGYLTTWSLSFPMEGVAAYSFDYQITGAITEGAVA